MIRTLKFNNFYSFHDDVELDLTVNKRAPDTGAYYTGVDEMRTSKVMSIVGPNASGKTNLLKSVVFVDWFVSDSFYLKPDDDIPFKQFLFDTRTRPSDFEVVFETNGKVYEYAVSLTTKHVISERLRLKRKKFRTLYKRIWDEDTEVYKYDFRGYDLPADFPQLLRPNASVLSTARQINHEQSQEIINYFATIRTNISEIGKVHGEPFSRILEFYAENDMFRGAAERILNEYDVGLSQLKIEKVETGKETNRYVGYASHNYIDKEGQMWLSLDYESTGTRNLLALLKTILIVLASGGVAILDEMDSDLHPLIVSEIVSLFASETTNPRNAQLIFSTHSVHILNRLDKYQIV
ncbi:MAG: abortive infection protein, partial [Parcubacteria group bacterium Athens0416_74]